MATDVTAIHGIQLATFYEATIGKLKQPLPLTASIHNPMVVIVNATHERYESVIRDIIMDDLVDRAIVIQTPQAMTDILETAEILPRVVEGIHNQCYGFTLFKSRIVRDANEIEAAVSETGLSVAMKIISPDISHKLDSGGVQINIDSIEQAKIGC
jgi:acyl-CoA synthetase (NDP forming)